MLRQLRKNEKGVVFVTVLMIIIVLMVLAISVISMNVSQVMSTEGEVDRIRGEMLGIGMLAQVFAQASNSAFNSLSSNYLLDNTYYSVDATVGTPDASGLSNVIINVSY